jgi:WD40 repeat protein
MRYLPLLLLLSCDPDPNQDAITSEVASLRVEPASMDLETTAGVPAEAQFEALATFDNGEEAPIDLVSWSVSNNSAGDVDDDGFFQAVDTNGGTTLVTATHLGMSASAEVQLVYVEHTLEDDLPEEIVTAFDEAQAGSSTELALLYPLDGVTVPRNLEGLVFLWPEIEGKETCRLAFRSELTDLSVYTTAGRWYASAELWNVITATNREGQVEVTVHCGSWDGSSLSAVVSGPGSVLTANRFDARGSVLYWESNTESIVRLGVGAQEREDYWTREDSDDNCTGCHVLSEGTDQLVVTHNGIQGTFSILDISEPDEPTLEQGPIEEYRSTFNTVSPDGHWMIATRGGELHLYDLTTGDFVSHLDTGGAYMTQPNWSPDGALVAAVRATGVVLSDMNFEAGEIVLMPWEDGALGEATALVPADPGINRYAPAFSPDGEWIAYNRSTGDGYSDRDAELWLVSRDGSLDIRLDAANGEGEGAGGSMARWAPLPDDDVLWLAFSSRRLYAPERALEQPEQMPQIWISAIDANEAVEGRDPSRAPFWLPGQEIRSDNHLPVWWSQ